MGKGVYSRKSPDDNVPRYRKKCLSRGLDVVNNSGIEIVGCGCLGQYNVEVEADRLDLDINFEGREMSVLLILKRRIRLILSKDTFGVGDEVGWWTRRQASNPTNIYRPLLNWHHVHP